MQQENDGLKKKLYLCGPSDRHGNRHWWRVFFKVASVVESTQSAGLTLLVWVLGGLLTICAGLTIAELALPSP